MNTIADIRREYEGTGLHETDLANDPFLQFEQWFAQAKEHEGQDVNAMTLATASATGKPSARIVLLKGVDQGFLFFTNYESHKGKELEENPYGALVFWWRTQNRQVRVEGYVEKVAAEISSAYFDSRPRGSRIGAVASPQSQIIEDREILEKRARSLEEEYGASQEIPRPVHWGGYRLRPTLIEFWQGRESRLHDRLQYRKEGEEWMIERLAP